MSKLKQIDKRLLTILMIVFVQMLGTSMVLPILPLYAQNLFELSPQTISLLLASFFAAQFVAGPFLGRWSDRVGRLPVLIASQIGTVISFVMLGLAGNAGILFFARIFDGITGGNIIVAQAYITDITPPEKRTESLGYIFAAFGLGFIFGPGIGGFLSAQFGPRVPFYIAAVAALLTVLLTWYTLDETITPDQRKANVDVNKPSLGIAAVFSNYPLLTILGIAFSGQFVLGLIQATFALYGESVIFADYTTEQATIGIGVFFTVIGLSQFIVQSLVLRPLLKRYGETMLVIFGSVLRGLSMTIFAVLATPIFGAIASLLFAAGMGLMMPPLQGLTTRTVADEWRGEVLGYYQSIVSLSTIVSVALGGWLYEANPRLPYWVGVGLSVVVIMPALYLLRHPISTQPTPTLAPTPTD